MTTVIIAVLSVVWTEPGGAQYWRELPMQNMEACEIAASMVWENVGDIHCDERAIEVIRPKPRPEE